MSWPYEQPNWWAILCPSPKASTAGAQSCPQQCESNQQEHSPTPSDLFKRLDTSEKWKYELTAERSHVMQSMLFCFFICSCLKGHMIAAFSVIWFDITLQKFLFCVFAGLVISKMLFGSECFITRCARNIFFTVDIPVMLCECFLGLELFATDITNKVRSHVNFGFFRYFDPLQARVCFRLTLKLCLETFTFLMTGATQASCRNKWLSVLLWDLKGLRGKRIAQNMGTKIGLIKLIYFVIFCAGCRGWHLHEFKSWVPSTIDSESLNSAWKS